jgi:mycofactocin precursor
METFSVTATGWPTNGDGSRVPIVRRMTTPVLEASPDETPVLEVDDLVLDEVLIEEISIDGMCGVY